MAESSGPRGGASKRAVDDEPETDDGVDSGLDDVEAAAVPAREYLSDELMAQREACVRTRMQRNKARYAFNESLGAYRLKKAELAEALRSAPADVEDEFFGKGLEPAADLAFGMGEDFTLTYGSMLGNFGTMLQKKVVVQRAGAAHLQAKGQLKGMLQANRNREIAAAAMQQGYVKSRTAVPEAGLAASILNAPMGAFKRQALQQQPVAAAAAVAPAALGGAAGLPQLQNGAQ